MLVVPLVAEATPEEVVASIVETFCSSPLAGGPVEIDLPPLAESGNSVPMTVRVLQSGVKRLAVFSEHNPRPKICEVPFGPALADPALTTNIRLSSTQAVVCVAEMLDGSPIVARREVKVTVGASTTLPSRY